MKLESVEIKNFRAFKEETVCFDDYNCFVGPNGSGKSTVINALNVFFRQHKDSETNLTILSAADFHRKNTELPISITVTFKDLSKEAKEDFSNYVRQGKLIVTAEAIYDEINKIAEVKQFGSRLGMADFKEWFEAEKNKAKAPELKEIFGRLKQKWPGISSATTKIGMEEALKNFEEKHSENCSLIPSEDQFYGVSKGQNRIEKHLQWVFVAASKDFSEESEENKNSALGQLLSRAIRAKVNFPEKVTVLKEELKKKYQEMLEKEQKVLSDISKSLDSKLKEWASPNATVKVLWKDDAEKQIKIEEPFAHIQIGEKGFESELARFGHGMQRSYLLTLLQVLADIADKEDKTPPTLIMAIEEPELYQHPPQARYLSEVLQKLSTDNSQIIACSHSPYFIPSDNFHNVRMVKEVGDPPYSTVKSLQYDDLDKELTEAGQKSVKKSGMIAMLYPILRPEISEMFFSKKLILVEGIEDVAYLTSYIYLMDKLSDFRQYGYHIIPVGGKSELIKPLAIAKLLDIKVFVVCDADTDKENSKDSVKKDDDIKKHQEYNAAILHLLGHDKGDNWPNEDIKKPNLVMWKTSITETIKSEFGDKWEQHKVKAFLHYENPGKLGKNPLAISRALESAWEAGLKSETLQELVNSILDPTKQ